MADETYRPDQLVNHANRFVLLSGCSGGGKSTLLAALRKRGFVCFEEPGRQVVREQLLIGGPGLPWQDPSLFAELCVSRAIQQMATAAGEAGPVFFDRGIVDAVAFFDYLGRDVPEHIERAARLLRYAPRMFLTPPWREIFAGDAERRHSYDEAVAQYEASLVTFRRLGYETIELPKATIERRVEFILASFATAISPQT